MEPFSKEQLQAFSNYKIWNRLCELAEDELGLINDRWREEGADISYLKGLAEGLEFFPKALQDMLHFKDAQAEDGQPPGSGAPTAGTPQAHGPARS